MRPPLALLATLIATAFLSGCMAVPASQPSPEAGTNSWEPTPRSTPATQDPAPPPPAEPDPAPSAPGVPGPGDEKPEPEVVARPIHVEGRTPARYCRQYPNGCIDLERAENTTIRLDGVADPSFLEGNLTWNASTYTTGHLRVLLMVYEGNRYAPVNGFWYDGDHGASPLFVSMDLSRYAGKKLALSIAGDECMLDTAPAANCAFAGSYGLEPGQDFTFEGQLTGWTTNQAASGSASA